MLEKKTRKRGIHNQGWARNARIAKRVSKSRKIGEKGIQIAMIGILAMRSYVEMVGNEFKTTCTLILTSNQRHKTSK